MANLNTTQNTVNKNFTEYTIYILPRGATTNTRSMYKKLIFNLQRVEFSEFHFQIGIFKTGVIGHLPDISIWNRMVIAPKSFDVISIVNILE
jgi:hypothetical protein